MINTFLFKWYRKRCLQKTYNIIREGNYKYCCSITHSLINFSEIKEVIENNKSVYLHSDMRGCYLPRLSNIGWFSSKTDRLKFLQECLNKF